MTIAEFFLRLATDETLLRQFEEDARGTLIKEGLSDEDRALLLTGEARELRVKVEATFFVGNEKVSYHTVYTVPTVYLPPPPPPPPDTTQS